MLAPGTVILLVASCTWDGGSSATQTAIVVENPAIARRVYCASPVRQYKVAGEWRSWAELALAGVKVRVQPPGSMWPVEGVATNRATVVVGGKEHRWLDL